jgi:hypothetical protein
VKLGMLTMLQYYSTCISMVCALYSLHHRVVGLQADASDGGVLDNSFKLAWKALMNGEAIKCSSTFKHVEAVRKPSFVVLDVSSSAVPHTCSPAKFTYSRDFNCHGSRSFDLNHCIHPFFSG